MAATVMDKALEKGDLTAKALAAYGRAFKKEFGTEMAILTRVAKMLRNEPLEMLKRGEADPSIPPLVVKMFMGEGDIRRTALRLYGKNLLAGRRR